MDCGCRTPFFIQFSAQKQHTVNLAQTCQKHYMSTHTCWNSHDRRVLKVLIIVRQMILNDVYSGIYVQPYMFYKK